MRQRCGRQVGAVLLASEACKPYRYPAVQVAVHQAGLSMLWAARSSAATAVVVSTPGRLYGFATPYTASCTCLLPLTPDDVTSDSLCAARSAAPSASLSTSRRPCARAQQHPARWPARISASCTAPGRCAACRATYLLAMQTAQQLASACRAGSLLSMPAPRTQVRSPCCWVVYPPASLPMLKPMSCSIFPCVG